MDEAVARIHALWNLHILKSWRISSFSASDISSANQRVWCEFQPG
jgi:hypothetical protein